LKEPRHKLKVSLEVRDALNAAAMRIWEAANRQYDAEVRAAKAGRTLHEKAATGRYDRLTDDMLKFLGETLEHRWHVGDEQSLKTKGGEWADRRLAGWEEHETDRGQVIGLLMRWNG